MNRKTLIIVTLLFMLIIGALLFFTLFGLKNGNEPSLKIDGITSSAVAGERTVITQNEQVYDDYIIRKGCND